MNGKHSRSFVDASFLLNGRGVGMNGNMLPMLKIKDL